MTKHRSKQLLLSLGQAILVLTIAAIFTTLGLWQWERAEQHQELEAELTEISRLEPAPLTSLHLPQIALDGEVTNRMVNVSGRYLDFYRAAGQREGEYQVALLEVADSTPRGAILVARQIVDQGASLPSIAGEPTGQIQLLARLMPTQREDRDSSARIGGSPDLLARIDSAILLERLADPSLALYDGYLLVHEERVGSEPSALDRIPDVIAEPTIPGYYWQHISYVVIWLLMAGLTLYLPIYQQRRNRLPQ